MPFNMKQSASYGLKNTIEGMEYFFYKFNESYKKNKSINSTTGLSELNFLLSAFLNHYQGIKDILQRLGKINLEWNVLNDSRQERIFFKKIRNIYTHQGNMLINTCHNNNFFIAGPISYINEKGKVIPMTPLPTPVNDLVFLFFQGIIEYLLKEINNNNIELEFGLHNNIEHEIKGNTQIPQNVKDTITNILKNKNLGPIHDEKNEAINHFKNIIVPPYNEKDEFINYLKNIIVTITN